MKINNYKNRYIAISLATLPIFACIPEVGLENSVQSQSDSQSDFQQSPVCLSKSASVVGLSDTSIELTGNALIKGSVVLMGNSSLRGAGNAGVAGTVYSHSVDQVNIHKNKGTIILQDFTSKEPVIWDFVTNLDGLNPTLVFDSISSNLRIVGNGGLNVVQVNQGIHLSGKDKLILAGSEADQFIFLVKDVGINLSGQASVVTEGGVSSRKVLFRVGGAKSVSITGNGTVLGTFLAPQGTVFISGNGSLEGAFLALGTIQISGNGVSVTPSAWCPQIDFPYNGPNDPSPTPSSSPSSGPSPDVSPDPSPTPSDGSPSPTPSETPTPTCTGLECGVLGI